MPELHDWHPGDLDSGSPVWKELVPDRSRAISLRHPSYPVEGTVNDVDGLLTLAAGYLRKVAHDVYGLPDLFGPPDSSKFRENLPLNWLSIKLADLPGPSVSVWVKRFEDPLHPVHLIDRTAILLAVQTTLSFPLPGGGQLQKIPLRSRLGIRIVAHVSPEATARLNVRITSSSCSADLKAVLDTAHGGLLTQFLPVFLNSVTAQDDSLAQLRAATGLADDVPIVFDGVRPRGNSLSDLYADAGRAPDDQDGLPYRLIGQFDMADPLHPKLLSARKSPLVSGVGPVQAKLVAHDPASEPPATVGTGDIVDARPNRSPNELERYRQWVDLTGLAPGATGRVTLADDLIEVRQSPIVRPPGDPKLPQDIADPMKVTHARTNDFAALSGWEHARGYRYPPGDARPRGLFDLLLAFGFSPDQYFRSAALPLLVRYRATIRPGPGKDGRTVNAQVDYDPTGGGAVAEDDGTGKGKDAPIQQLQVRFALADLKRSWSEREPLGLTADPRWSWHEYGHVLLAAASSALELPFVHSAGDALAAIVADPESVWGAPRRVDNGVVTSQRMRFATFPWVHLNRRHDRSVWLGWGWCGTYHRPQRFAPAVDSRRKGYDTEQILSTSLFRLYQALGGDTVDAAGAADVAARLLASHYTVYLVMRVIASLGQASAVPIETPDQLVTALCDADVGTLPPAATPPDGKVGGWAYKVVEWAFAEQGLGATTDPQQIVNAPGPPPDVDIFIADLRRGLASPPLGDYRPVSLDWNGTPAWHAHPQAIQVGNHVTVEVRNRGTSDAHGVKVKIRYIDWAGGPVPPWDPATWKSLAPSAAKTVRADGNPVTFQSPLLPASGGRRLILAEANCPADPANTAASVPCATKPTPLVDLVAGDNNLGLRVH